MNIFKALGKLKSPLFIQHKLGFLTATFEENKMSRMQGLKSEKAGKAQTLGVLGPSGVVPRRINLKRMWVSFGGGRERAS